MTLEELGDTGQCLEWYLVSAGMNIRHKLRAIHARLCAL